MSGFLDELELIGEAKEVPEEFPGDGVKSVTSSEYMGRLPEHQSEDLDTECPECKRVRKVMEPGSDRPVVAKKVQVQHIPGDGIKPVNSGVFMSKLPQHQSVDAVEPTKDTACTMRPMNEMEELRAEIAELKQLLKENTVSQATPIAGANNTNIDKAMSPVKDPKIKKMVESDEEIVSEAVDKDKIKKGVRKAATNFVAGVVGNAVGTTVGTKISGKKLNAKNIAKSALLGGAGAVAGGALNDAVKKLKTKAKKSESFEVEIDELSGTFAISEDTMLELMEDFDFELTEEEIMGLVSEALTVPESIPGNGIRDVESGKFMGKLPQYQSVEEAKPRKEDEAYSGQGSIVKPHDASEDDAVANDIADIDKEDEALDEAYTFTKGKKSGGHLDKDSENSIKRVHALGDKSDFRSMQQMSDEEFKKATDDYFNGRADNIPQKFEKNGTGTVHRALDKNRETRTREENPTPLTAPKGSTRVAGKSELMAKHGDKIKLAAAIGATAATSALAYHAYKKYKAKKGEKVKENEKVSEATVDVIMTEDTLYVFPEEMDFLLEACNYELTVEEIGFNILEAEEKLAIPTPKKEQKQELPGDGIKDVDPECERKFDKDSETPEKDQQYDESTDIEVSIFNPIKLTESEVRLIPQYGKYLISESDYESVCYNYAGRFNGYEVLDLIAEAHGVNSDDIYVMMAESEVAVKKDLKKAIANQGSSNPDAARKRTEAKIARLQAQLKDTASGSATAKELRRKIKALRNSLR